MNNDRLKQLQDEYRLKTFRRINIVAFVLNILGSLILSLEISKTFYQPSQFYAGNQSSESTITIAILISLLLSSTILYYLLNAIIEITENSKINNHLLLELKHKDDILLDDKQ